MWVVWVLCLGLWGCSRCGGSKAGPVAATYSGGEVTEAEVQQDAARLPADLRAQFESEYGRREFVRAMVDKRLLMDEARRRGLHERPDIQRQVRELEQRLTLQALLAQEREAAGTPNEADARTYFETHRDNFAEPARVRIGRAIARFGAGANEAARSQARKRAEGFVQRLKRGESIEAVATDGDGPERARGGELGLFAKGEFPNAAVEKAAGELARPGALSGVVAEPDGYSVLVLLEQRAGRTPAFEEVRPAVENRLEPVRQRKVFDQLLERLRSEAHVEIRPSGHP